MVVRGASANITRDLGNFSSSYTLLISIPQGIASALSASMLPSIVASYTTGDKDSIYSKLTKTLKTNMFVAVPSFIGLFTIGEPIIRLLFARYDSVQGGMMLKLGAVAIVFYIHFPQSQVQHFRQLISEISDVSFIYITCCSYSACSSVIHNRSWNICSCL